MKSQILWQLQLASFHRYKELVQIHSPSQICLFSILNVHVLISLFDSDTASFRSY